jgi:hypothetical protein
LRPDDVAVDAGGTRDVIVVTSNLFQRYDDRGHPLASFELPTTEFAPGGVAIDSTQRIHITSRYHDRVHRFESAGAHLGYFGGFGSGAYEFDSPAGISFSGAGELFVADADNHRVMRYAANSEYRTTIGSFGAEDGELGEPNDVAISAAERV